MRFILALIPALVLAACGNPEAETCSEMDPAAPGDMGAQEQGPVSDQATAIDIRASWMRPHPSGRDVTAAYIVLDLSEGSEDLLQSVEIDGAERVELHGHFMTSEGVMQMREIGPQRVSDEGPLVFTPGGRHLMVFGLAPVVEGDTVNGTLNLQNAGAVPVTFEVRSMPPGQASED